MLKRAAILLIAMLFPIASYAQDADQLFAAARKGDVEAVKALLARGVDVNSKNRYQATPLMYAIDNGHTEVVKVLLEKGADINVKDTFYGKTPMTSALGKGQVDIVRFLVEKGADASGVLMSGINSNKIELVQLGLEKAKPNPETLSIALGLASTRDNPEMVELLKKAGAVMPPEANFEVDAATLQSYAGTYKAPDGSAEFVFTVKDGKLIGQATGATQSLTLGALDKTTFRPGKAYLVSYRFNEIGGKVVSVTMKYPNFTMELKKQ